MLAAVSGLAYTLATLLKLDSYLGYFLPLPVIIAAMRSGPAAARKTVTATCFLLLRKLPYLLCNGCDATSPQPHCRLAMPAYNRMKDPCCQMFCKLLGPVVTKDSDARQISCVFQLSLPMLASISPSWFKQEP